MTIPEIYNLKKAGELDRAYQECSALLHSNPDDRQTRIAMAWCIKSLTERYAETTDYNLFLRIFNKYAELKVWELGELLMSNRFAWDIKTLFKNLESQLADVRFHVANQIFATVQRLQFSKPNKYYTLLLDSFIKLKGPQNEHWSDFDRFMDWWGFDNFTPEDYNPIQLRNGNHIIPIVAQAYSAYYKSIKRRIENNDFNAEAVNAFIDRLGILHTNHPEYQYTLLHRSKLLLALNRQDEALEAIRPFVRRFQQKSWVWDILSQTTNDAAVKLSCLCRALSCRDDDSFLAKMRIKAAMVMLQNSFPQNAKLEISKSLATYQRNGWHIPAELQNLTNQEWFRTTPDIDSNADFYNAHLSESENFLFLDSPEVEILISHFNTERRICNFITTDRRRGFFSTRNLRGIRFGENSVLKVRFENGVQPDSISTVVSARQITDLTPYENVFFKTISGMLRIRQGNAYGFVNDIYVDPSLIGSQLTDGNNVSGTAVITFNRRREEFSWKAISLNPA